MARQLYGYDLLWTTPVVPKVPLVCISHANHLNVPELMLNFDVDQARISQGKGEGAECQ